MKKLISLLIILSVLLACYQVAISEDIPKPFDKVKEYALMGKKDSGGCWINKWRSGERRFACFFCERDRSIAIFGYMGETFVGVAVGNKGFQMVTDEGPSIISREDAILIATTILKEIEKPGLIPLVGTEV